MRSAVAMLVFLLAGAGALPAQRGAGGPPARIGRGPRMAPGRGFRFLNPATPAARLMLATPAQRARVLADLPPGRQEQIRRQLAWFDSLPRRQQLIQIERIERFASLSPERREAVRLRMQALNALPPPRRQAIRRALAILQNTPEDRRAARMDSTEFRSRFSEEELGIIHDLADAWLPTMRERN